MNQVTIVFPYYMNPTMLKRQADIINAYPEFVRSNLELIVVDDCSPMDYRAEKAIRELGIGFLGYKFQLYRVLTNLPWGWLQCRNMGAKFATNKWLMLTDIDHVIPSDTIEYLVQKEFNIDKFYTFNRVNYPMGDEYKPHPNSYFMTKDFYWKVGGYDEIFAGHYGTDGMWRRRCEDQGKGVRLGKEYPIMRVDRQVIPDASTTTLDRKDNRDPNALDEVRAFKEEHKVGIQVMRLPWKKII